MKIRTELEALYQGGLQSKIALQNDPLVRNLATWLVESSLQARWEFYSSLVRPRVETGGPVILCERSPSTAWLDDLMLNWQKAARTGGLSILHAFASQMRSPVKLDWEAIARELVPVAARGSWIAATGEALIVCSSCSYYMLSDWGYVRSVDACPSCKSDVFKFLPVAIPPVVKESIMRGVLMEVAIATAVAKAGGILFKVPAGELGDHYVSLQFHHPVSPVEIDMIGDLGETLLIIECKDPKASETLAINNIELTASKVSRLVKELGDAIQSRYRLPPRLLFVTTGQLHQNLERKKLAKGELSSLPCFVVDRGDLMSICNRLLEFSSS